MQTQIFPPKEVAMELKKVGFDWGCVGYYCEIHDIDCITPIIHNKIIDN